MQNAVVRGERRHFVKETSYTAAKEVPKSGDMEKGEWKDGQKNPKRENACRAAI